MNRIQYMSLFLLAIMNIGLLFGTEKCYALAGISQSWDYSSTFKGFPIGYVSQNSVEDRRKFANGLSNSPTQQQFIDFFGNKELNSSSDSLKIILDSLIHKRMP